MRAVLDDGQKAEILGVESMQLSSGSARPVLNLRGR